MPDPVVTPPAAPIPDPALANAITSAINAGFQGIAARLQPPAPAPAAAPAPVAAPAAPAAPAPAADANAAARLAVVEQQLAEARERETTATRNAALDAAFAGTKDYSAAQLSALRAVLERDHGKHISVVDGKVVYNTPQTGQLDVAKFVSDHFMKSDVALALKPAPTLPGGDPLKPTQGQPAAAAKPAHAWEGKTMREVTRLAQTNPAAFNDLTKNYPDAWKRIAATI